jgi:predicted PurR-regulated permease PerM
MLFIILASIILYYGKGFLIPLTFGAMFSFLVNPIHSKLRKLKLNKYLSAIASVITIIALVFIFLSAFGWQIQQIYEQKDEINKTLMEKRAVIQDYAQKWFGISIKEQKEDAEKVIESLEGNASGFFGSALGMISNFFLSLIYAILFLTERRRISEFFKIIIPKKSDANDIIEDVSQIVQKYLSGKLIIIGLLAIVYAIGFLILGIQYAILIAVLAAFFTFIPYIGNIIGGSIAAIITFATGGTMVDIFIIFAIMGTAQMIESYILEPWIVGSNVELNPLFSILAVIVMSILWGAAGAVLALPLIGMLKIIFDNFEYFQPIGFLMGDEDVK